ncbi:MAG: hypothetical protein IJ213_08195 [Bacteroidales bacterium]|nr:hypothetical protein [Bacteroidales bacterium]
MEENTILEQEEKLSQQQCITMTPSFKNEFLSTVKWGKYIGIMMYISAGLIVLLCIAMAMFPASLADSYGVDDAEDVSIAIGSIVIAITVIIMLLCAGLTVFFGYKLQKGCTELEKGCMNNSQNNYLAGIHHIKIFTQVCGVLMIISLFIAFLSVLGTFAAGILSAL